MMDALKYALTTIAVACSGILFMMSFVLWLHERHIYPLYELTKLARRPKFELFLLLFIVCGLIQYGATKGTNGNDCAAFWQSMRVAPRVVPVAVDSDGFCMPTNFPTVTNLCFWGIEKSSGSVALGIAWPENYLFENSAIDVFGHWQLSTNGWCHLAEIDVSEASSNAIVEIETTSFPTNLMENAAFFRMASQDDADGDGVSDKIEEWCIGSNPASNDSDADLIYDGEEIGLGINPNSTDTDGDGLSDMEELCIYETNPLIVDSDGDGLPDGWEISNGLDPLESEGPDGAEGDPYGTGMTNAERYGNGGRGLLRSVSRSSTTESNYVSSGADWVVITGDSDAGVTKSTNATVSISRGTKAFVGVFLQSDEYPYYTGYASEYNDVLSWTVTAPGNVTMSGDTRVNDEDGSWSAANDNDQYIGYWDPVVFERGTIYTAPTNQDLVISINISAMNVSDGACPSSVIVGVFPLEILQSNWPIGMGFENVTDSGSTVNKRLVEHGIGYVPALPARPVIKARFADLPEWMTVTWSATLTKERSERPASDNKTLPAVVLFGDDEYDLYGRLDCTIGGSIVLNYNVAGASGGVSRFKVRGKNPRDSVALAYINSIVPSAARGFGWKIARHESKQGTRVYNQFNTGTKKELPNKGSGLGWGIAQIDNHDSSNADLTPYSQVWDWHENIKAMTNKLTYAINRTTEFLGYYRTAYGNRQNWTEPPSTNILNETVSAEMWCIATIYNGVGGIPAQSAGVHSGFHCPMEFKPETGRWVFHTNTTNPHYVRKVVGAGRMPTITE